MVTQPNDSPKNPNSQTQAELDLLQAIFQTDRPYPWNPAQPESEDYFTDLGGEWRLPDCLSESEMTQKTQTLFAQIEQLWTTTTLQKDLCDKFVRVPQDLIVSITRNVQTVTTQYQSLADRMVQCVLSALPQWPEEDLHVLARPLAYAMREVESESLESTLIADKSWSELSEIEQARASLAIARYAISQLTARD